MGPGDPGPKGSQGVPRGPKGSQALILIQILSKTRNERELNRFQWIPVGPKGSQGVPRGPKGSDVHFFCN